MSTTSPSAGSSAGQARQRGLHVWRAMLSTWLILGLLTASGVTLFYRHLNQNTQTGSGIEHVNEKSGKAMNILVLGSDSRDGKGNDIDGLTGGGQRADTTILLHVSADRKRAYGVSIPRDALVTRATCKAANGDVVPVAKLQMFNTAFSVGGPTCTLRTLERMSGLSIDHYVVVDFRGFKDMVDAVDGVRVCIPEDVDDPAHGISLDAGTQTLKGQDALNYVRERYVLSANSDIGRMKRQQAFIASMVNKVVSAGTLSNPARVVRFLDAATKSLTVDPGLDNTVKIANLGLTLKDTGLSQIKFVSVPSTPYEPDPNRLVLTDAAKTLWQRMQADKPLGPAFSDGAISAKDPVEPGSQAASGTGKPKTAKQKARKAAAEAARQAQAAENGLCA